MTVYRIDNSLFETCLLQDIIQGARWNFNVRFAGNRDGALLRSMFELAMTPFHAGLIPAILFKQFDDFSNFHASHSENLTMPPNARGNRAAARKTMISKSV
jgi:hypothetical protein